MGSGQRLQGERPWTRLPRAAGRLRQGQRLTSHDSAHEACRRASRTSGWLSVVRARHPLDLPCAALAPGTPDGGRTVWQQWQRDAAQQMAALHGAHPAPVVPSTMVLHYYVSALAEASVQLALASERVPPPVASWSVRRAGRGGHVHLVGVPETGWGSGASVGPRLDAAHEGYREHAEGVARSYPASVKTSSRQRLGLVGDAWQSALLGERDQLTLAGLAHRLPPEPRLRQACCFIVALPGTRACAGCPRLR